MIARQSDDLTLPIWQALADVPDPEIPVLSVLDLGMVRDVSVSDSGQVVVKVTPTYSGCPATDTIAKDIVQHLTQVGFPDSHIEMVLSPPWSSAWINDQAREKLRQYGITPPDKAGFSKQALLGREPVVRCPKCGAKDTRKVSEFGSTPCKAHYQCNACKEPFDYFKCI